MEHLNFLAGGVVVSNISWNKNIEMYSALPREDHCYTTRIFSSWFTGRLEAAPLRCGGNGARKLELLIIL